MEKEKAVSIIKTIYLYLVALVGIVILVIGMINTLNIGIKYFVFGIRTQTYEANPRFSCEQTGKYYGQGGYINTPATDVNGNPVEVKKPSQEEIDKCIVDATADQTERYRREIFDSLAWAIAAIIVGTPLWLYHWKIIKKHTT